MKIVRAFIEGLSWCQRYLFSTLHLHHNGALQYVLALAGSGEARVNIEKFAASTEGPLDPRAPRAED